MIINLNEFMEWLDDIDPRTFYESDILYKLKDFGFSMVFSGNRNQKCEMMLGDDTHTLTLNTWDDDFQALLYRGLPFFVIDENHVGEPEFHDGKHAGYAVVNPADVDLQSLSMLGAGYIYRNDKAMQSTTISGGSLIRALARLIAKKSPGDEFHGRGFAARADLEAIKNAISAQFVYEL